MALTGNDILLPRAQSALVNRDGTATIEFRNFLLRFVQDAGSAGAVTAEQLAALTARVQALEDAALEDMLQGFASVAVNGHIIYLVGDVANPQGSQYYGTDRDGARGWYNLIDGFEAGTGLTKTLSTDGFNLLGYIDSTSELPPTANVNDAYILNGRYIYWNGTEWTDGGAPSNIATLALAPAGDTGAGTLQAVTVDTYGRVIGKRAATITGTASQIVVANGDASAGLPTISLADLANSGVGAALVKITRDAKGRIAGTQAATTDDLTEGSANLYFTNARADARITLQKAQPNGLASLDASGKLEVTQLPALAITETFVVSSQAAMLALVAQQGDVAVRTDLSKSFILTASPASTLSNWQELLSPTGMSGTVTSVGTGAGLTGGPITVSGTVALNSASIASLALADSAVQPATLTAGLATKQNNPGSWAAPTLINGFADLGSPFNPSGYRSATNRVDIRGVVASASHTSSPIIFTLPVGLRPVNRTIRMTGGSFPTIGFVVTRIDIYPNGDVQLLNPVTTTTNFVVLDGISFEL